MKRSVLTPVAAAVLAGAAGLGAQGGGRAAQPAAATPQRNWYSVTITTLKPERVAEWLEIQKSQQDRAELKRPCQGARREGVRIKRPFLSTMGEPLIRGTELLRTRDD